MLYVDRSLQRIRGYARDAKLDAEAFGRLASVPGSTARRLLWHRGNPTYQVIAAMEAVVPASYVGEVGGAAGDDGSLALTAEV
jgi:hypothetical protein